MLRLKSLSALQTRTWLGHQPKHTGFLSQKQAYPHILARFFSAVMIRVAQHAKNRPNQAADSVLKIFFENSSGKFADAAFCR
jgi:hypothetical protein